MEQKNKEESMKIVVRVPKLFKEQIYKAVAKSSYSSASELIRAGIEKELKIQSMKDNLDFISKELSKLIDIKLDGFISSQRKLYANNVRISAINTYAVGEMLKRILGDELHEDFIAILKSAREKANYYVSRKPEDISKEELSDFFSIGKDYRNE